MPAVLATIVSRKGSSPRETGTKMLVWPDGSCIGTIGGGCMEAGLLTEARRMLSARSPSAKLCPIDLTGAQAEEDGMICGGKIQVLLELIMPKAAQSDSAIHI